MVVVFVRCACEQSHSANAKFTQFAASWQARAHVFQIDIPSARNRFAPQQCSIEVEQRATSAGKYGVHHVLGLGFEFGGPSRNAHTKTFLIQKLNYEGLIASR